MPRNLALAFGELLVGGVMLEAAIKGASLGDVVRGTASSSGTGLSDVLSSSSGCTASSTASTVSLDSLGFGTGAPVSTGTKTQQTAVADALSRAESLEGAPYTYGGGHSTGALTATAAVIKQAGIDCSGFVSNVLGPLGAGVLTSPQTTQTIPSASGISAGKGQYITIYDRNTGDASQEHTIINIAGQWFESGGMIGKGVINMTSAQAQAELSGGTPFNVYHPQGL